jgi:nitrite reductase (NO-forming)
VNVIVGASIATLFLAGQPDIVANWAAIKPAHAWLNLFGFVSLVICSSLVHLYPTVVGAHMDRTRWSAGAVVALAAAPPIVALGYVLRTDPVAQAGGLTMVAGAASLLVAFARTWRSRGRWTTDAGWHAMAIGSLSAGLAWFSLGVATAVAGVLLNGARPAGWSVTELIAPLGVGFVVQVVIGAWTHLLPAIGPGSPGVHAAARRRLGTVAWPRLAVLNVGAASMFAGSLAGNGDLVRVGLLVAGIAVVTSLGLFGVTVAGMLVKEIRPTPSRSDAASSMP